MTDAARKHDARYADFAARMLAALASEEAFAAKCNASKYEAPTSSEERNAATVRPSK